MRKNILIRLFVICLMCSIFSFGCASSADQDLEAARFALDSGDWDAAIEHANVVLSEDPANIDASLLLASAYSGKSGVKVVNVFSKVANFVHKDTIFKTVHDSLTSDRKTEYNSDYLRNALIALTERLRPMPDEYDELYDDHLFKTVVLLAVEAYATPGMISLPTKNGQIDVKKITDEVKNNIENDLIRADDLLLKYGFEETDDPVKQIRYTYCQLQMASGSEEGFEKEALQDLVLCQLLGDSDSLSKLSGDLNSRNISTCEDFKFSECEDLEPTK